MGAKSKPETFEQAFDRITRSLKEIMVEKRRLRGHENIERQGLQGVVTRMAEDKLARIQREVEITDFLVKAQKFGIPIEVLASFFPQAASNRESLEDDLADVANYAIIALMLQEGTWSLPMEVNHA